MGWCDNGVFCITFKQKISQNVRSHMLNPYELQITLVKPPFNH